MSAEGRGGRREGGIRGGHGGEAQGDCGVEVLYRDTEGIQQGSAGTCRVR